MFIMMFTIMLYVFICRLAWFGSCNGACHYACWASIEHETNSTIFNGIRYTCVTKTIKKWIKCNTIHQNHRHVQEHAICFHTNLFMLTKASKCLSASSAHQQPTSASKHKECSCHPKATSKVVENAIFKCIADKICSWGLVQCTAFVDVVKTVDFFVCSLYVTLDININYLYICIHAR